MGLTYLLLGSNLGNRESMLEKALIGIRSEIGEVNRKSKIYETEPWGYEDDKMYLNQVFEVNTDLSPQQLMDHILKIEKRLGRVRLDGEISAREIDIDILLYDDIVIQEKDLIIPHPRFHLRKFALLALAELDGSLIHPVMDCSVKKLLEKCEDPLEVKVYTKEGIITAQ